MSNDFKRLRCKNSRKPLVSWNFGYFWSKISACWTSRARCWVDKISGNCSIIPGYLPITAVSCCFLCWIYPCVEYTQKQICSLWVPYASLPGAVQGNRKKKELDRCSCVYLNFSKQQKRVSSGQFDFCKFNINFAYVWLYRFNRNTLNWQSRPKMRWLCQFFQMLLNLLLLRRKRFPNGIPQVAEEGFLPWILVKAQSTAQGVQKVQCPGSAFMVFTQLQ